MKPGIWLGVALGLWAASAPAQPPSLCERLAEQARQAPAALWTQHEPLAQWLRPEPAAGDSPVADALARDAGWRELLGTTPTRPVQVSRLTGTALHQIDSFDGTAPCQTFVLVEAHADAPAREVASPFSFAVDELCTTRSAYLAQALGEPVLAAGGALSMTSPTREIRLAPWTGSGWGPSCRLRWTLQTTVRPVRSFCPRGSTLCAPGRALALRVARAHRDALESDQTLDWAQLNGGRAPSAAIRESLGRLMAADDPADTMNPPFPLFGAPVTAAGHAMRDSFSYAGLMHLPLWLQGRWWLAKVGRSGIGWRQGDAILVALYAPPGRAADAVASYQFLVEPTGLQAVNADGSATAR